MNAQSRVEAAPVVGLALLRAPFPEHHISKLPKPTKAQTEAVRNDFKKGVRCKVCGSWHHPEVIHLDYVGHAALTDRLLDADPEWSWEPLATTEVGLPAFDQSGGLWIKLTVCGVSRLGYGHAAAKPGVDPGAREKEVIGDALRNAAMRFGAALDLWHKGDLHLEEQTESGPGGDNSEARQVSPTGAANPAQGGMPDAEWSKLTQLIEATKTDTTAMLRHFKVKDLRFLNQTQYGEAVEKLTADLAAMAKAETNQAAGFGAVLEDEIPY